MANNLTLKYRIYIEMSSSKRETNPDIGDYMPKYLIPLYATVSPGTAVPDFDSAAEAEEWLTNEYPVYPSGATQFVSIQPIFLITEGAAP